MNDYKGPVFNKHRNNEPDWKKNQPRFTQSRQAMEFKLHSKQVDDKEMSPLLKKKKDFPQPHFQQAITNDTPSHKFEYEVAYQSDPVDASKWDLSLDYQSEPSRDWKRTEPTEQSKYAPALDKPKRVRMSQSQEESVEVTEEETVIPNVDEKTIIKNIREIAKRLTKTQDSYLLFK